MYIIVGLGNPGGRYALTRHNVGFHAIDFLADKYNIPVEKNKLKCVLGEGRIQGVRVVLAKPQTFMNLSGQAVVELCNWYKIAPEDELIVVYDDSDLAVGNIRIRQKGSAGTHNGMKNIIYLLGLDEFVRIRVGIGKRPKEWDMADYVLCVIPEEEKPDMQAALLDAVSAVQSIVQGKLCEAQQRFNKKKVVKDEDEQSRSIAGTI